MLTQQELRSCVVQCSIQLAQAGIKNEAYTKDRMGIQMKGQFFSFVNEDDNVAISDEEGVEYILRNEEYAYFVDWVRLMYSHA